MYHSFLIHSSTDGHLGCFLVLAIINSAAMNIGVHVSLSDLVSSVCMPRSGIAGSYGSSVIFQAPLSMEFSRQESLSRLPFPTPGDLPNPGMEPECPVSPAFQVNSLFSEPLGKPLNHMSLGTNPS